MPRSKNVKRWHEFGLENVRGFALHQPVCSIHMCTAHRCPIKPQLQIRAGAEKSTETREVINRYRKLGIPRSIPRCAVAVAMLIVYGVVETRSKNLVIFTRKPGGSSFLYIVSSVTRTSTSCWRMNSIIVAAVSSWHSSHSNRLFGCNLSRMEHRTPFLGLVNFWNIPKGL